MPHPLKRVAREKYLHEEPIAIIKDGAKSLDNEIDNFITLAHFYGSLLVVVVWGHYRSKRWTMQWKDFDIPVVRRKDSKIT